MPGTVGEQIEQIGGIVRRAVALLDLPAACAQAVDGLVEALRHLAFLRRKDEVRRRHASAGHDHEARVGPLAVFVRHDVHDARNFPALARPEGQPDPGLRTLAHDLGLLVLVVPDHAEAVFLERSVRIRPVLTDGRRVVDDEVAGAARQSRLDRVDARALAAAVRAQKHGVARKLDVLAFDQVEVDEGKADDLRRPEMRFAHASAFS